MQVHDRVAVNGISSMRWSLDQDLAFWSKAGIGRVGVPFSKMADHPDPVAAISAAPITVEYMVSTPAFTLGDPAQWPAQRDLQRERLALAAELGARLMYITTGPSPSRMPVDKSVDAFCEAVGPIVDAANELGVALGVEQNHSTTHDVGCIHTFDDLCMVADRTGIGIVAELQNCWVEYGIASKLAREAHHIVLVQVSDFEVGSGGRMARLCPGDGDIALEPLIEALLSHGYSGLFDIEILGPAIEELGYEQAIGRSVEWLSRVLEHLGAVGDGTGGA